jgi:hypothetical protein
MRYEQNIYVQNDNSCVRNSDILNVNMSSDISTFITPKFNISGCTKISEEVITCTFSGTNYNDLVILSMNNCFSGNTSCFDSLIWYLEVNIDSSMIYSDIITTSNLTANTITQDQIDTSIITAFDALNYKYSYTGSSFSIQKPYGVENLEVLLCLDINPITGCTISGDCPMLCTILCGNVYQILNTGDTGVYIINTATTIDLIFEFTANTESFISNNSTFGYEIYKYDNNNHIFFDTPTYTSNEFEYTTFSASSAITQSIPINNLLIDGEYIIKGYNIYNYGTEFLNRLGVKGNTLNKNGDSYGLYKKSSDYYFLAIKEADKPIFSFNTVEYQSVGTIFGYSLFPDYSGQTDFIFNYGYYDSPIVTLNGLTLINHVEYELSSNTLTISGGTELDDIISVIIISNGNNTHGFTNDIIEVSSPIISGVTNNQGNNIVYFNTTESKYEIYTTLSSSVNDNIVITLNGLTLAPNIDYYKSITNQKRIILNGDLMIDDLINIYYNSGVEYVGDIFTNTPTISWVIANKPENINGLFTIEVSDIYDTNFNNILFSGETQYIENQTVYSSNILLSGLAGTKYIYRVKNQKNYTTIIGDTITTINYSEIIPIQIQSNAINSY